ncbi:MAG: DUF2520 domain-containing protein [Cyclobacteriaceae bacterium]|nr:DUF2520 domain-containing protein [Cyclobacteriaceae bacterium]MCH8514936.1 DUF2520 domain-containing protein [Cyclobacteriaceae bacterium]
MRNYYRCGIVGSGNVAAHLSTALEAAGHHVDYIYGRTPSHVDKIIARLYNTESCDHDFSNKNIDVLFICVSDGAVKEVSERVLSSDDVTWAHCSGTLPKGILGYTRETQGVFYPLQSFTQGKEVDWDEVPIFVESENSQSLSVLKDIAKSLSSHVSVVDSETRRKIHLSAVFASNFSNQMLAIASDLMKKSGLDFKLLHPLVIETLNKATLIDPKLAQTGPAKRHDLETLDKHMELLSAYPEEAEIYRIISQYIIDKYPQ